MSHVEPPPQSVKMTEREQLLKDVDRILNQSISDEPKVMLKPIDILRASL